VRQRAQIAYRKSAGGRRLHFSSTGPLAALAIFGALTCLAIFGITAMKVARDYYFPYEGEVLRIEKRWYDHIAFEFPTWEHLIIKTPDGKTIDRLVSLEVRLPNRIAPGDYVVKKQGFGNAVRPRGKKTNQEIMDEWQAVRSKE